MNILFTIELADRLKDTGITVNVLHPGIVKTNFGKKQKGLTRMLIKLFSPFLLSPQEGAKTSIYLASSEDVENITGKYFEKSKIVELKNDFITRENMQTLWEKSMLLAELYDESQGY